MRITIVCDWWPPRVGGIESQLSELAPRLAVAGHRVHVLTTTRQPAASSGVVVEHVALRMLGSIIAPDLRRVRDIGVRLERTAPDVVHAHGAFSTLAVGSILAARRLGVPSVLTTHSLLRPWPVRALGAAVFRLFSGRADVITAVSAAAARDVRWASGRDVLQVPNGLGLSDWSAARVRRPGLRIVAVARLVPKKAPLDLIHALRRAIDHTQRTDVTLEIAGEGPQRPALERLIQRLDLSRHARLLGACSRETVRGLLADGSLFAHPGRYEAFGLALLEARASGLPVVAMASGGVPDLIEHGRHGLLASTRDEFCAATVRLVGDDDLRLRCAENASLGLEAYDWPQVVSRHEEVYERARQTSGRQVKKRAAAIA